MEIYIVNLHQTQRTSKLNINSLEINVNDIVLVFYEKMPRHFLRITIVTRVSPSTNSEIRGGIMSRKPKVHGSSSAASFSQK